MAEEPTKREQVIELVASDPNLVRQGMGPDGFRMPTEGQIGLYHLHQVHTSWRSIDPLITLDLFQGEQVDGSQIPEELDREFLAYAKDGRFHLKSEDSDGKVRDFGMVQTVTADKRQDPCWPNTYRLMPTLPETCHHDPDQAKARLAQAVEALSVPNPQSRIVLNLSHLQQALNGDAVVTLDESGKYPACWVQRRKTDTKHGYEVWIGRKPSFHTELWVKKGLVRVKSRNNGVIVCVSAEFVRNLVFVNNNVTRRDMAFLNEGYWRKR
jgi:hypothetical protein